MLLFKEETIAEKPNQETIEDDQLADSPNIMSLNYCNGGKNMINNDSQLLQKWYGQLFQSLLLHHQLNTYFHI